MTGPENAEVAVVEGGQLRRQEATAYRLFQSDEGPLG